MEWLPFICALALLFLYSVFGTIIAGLFARAYGEDFDETDGLAVAIFWPIVTLAVIVIALGAAIWLFFLTVWCWVSGREFPR